MSQGERTQKQLLGFGKACCSYPENNKMKTQRIRKIVVAFYFDMCRYFLYASHALFENAYGARPSGSNHFHTRKQFLFLMSFFAPRGDEGTISQVKPIKVLCGMFIFYSIKLSASIVTSLELGSHHYEQPFMGIQSALYV